MRSNVFMCLSLLSLLSVPLIAIKEKREVAALLRKEKLSPALGKQLLVALKDEKASATRAAENSFSLHETYHDAFHAYLQAHPSQQAARLRILFDALSLWKNRAYFVFRSTLSQLITRLFMVKKQYDRKPEAFRFELLTLTQTVRNQLLNIAQTCKEQSAVTQLIHEFIDVFTEHELVIYKQGMTIKKALKKIAHGAYKTGRFTLDIPLHLMGLPLRALNQTLRVLGVSDASARKPRDWFYRYMRVPTRLATLSFLTLAAYLIYNRQRIANIGNNLPSVDEIKKAAKKGATDNIITDSTQAALVGGLEGYGGGLISTGANVMGALGKLTGINWLKQAPEKAAQFAQAYEAHISAIRRQEAQEAKKKESNS